jgi:hypothetical protein
VGATNNVNATDTSSLALDFAVTRDSNGWQVEQPCLSYRDGFGNFAAGSDGTVYFPQTKLTSPYSKQLVAMRKGRLLWSLPFSSGCGGYQPTVYNPTLGFDGNLFVETYWGSNSSCSGLVKLYKINTATGAVLWSISLPSGSSANISSGLLDREVMPYSGGVAVANGSSIYYIEGGSIDSTKTYTLPTGNTFRSVRTAADGRSYIVTAGSSVNLYYKDLSSSTVHQISNITGKDFASVYPTSSGAVVRMTDTSSFDTYIGYFDGSGTKLYQKDLTSDNGGSVPSGAPIGIAVDGSNKVIVVRTESISASPNDQEVYVDSFDSTGTMTRLFNSETQFGTSARDVFTTTGFTSQALGNNQVYLGVCQEANGSTSKSCPWYVTPTLVSVGSTGSFDYPRSEIFAAESSKLNYVALGDSYSSGEGNSPFIIPSDSDGCHRSESNAYPELLLAQKSTLSLRAFVACSGATSDDIYAGRNGEASQLASLDSSTKVVSVTSGGDDAYFADFAYECVTSTCNTSSTHYQITMDEVDNYLQDNLELLYSRIHTAAPNATIYVLGYPLVATDTDIGCPGYIASEGEISAIETVTNGINSKIQAAITNSTGNFVYVDPTSTNSPFIGHDLCSSDSYFNGLEAFNLEYSFHPTSTGQEKYAELLANAMS